MYRSITFLTLIILLLVAMTTGLNLEVYGNLEDPLEEVDEIKEEIAEFEETIDLLNEDIERRLARLEELDQELAAIEQDLEDTEAALIQSQENLEETTKKFGGRVRSSYMKGATTYLETLLSADNFGDLIIRLAYMQRIADRDAEIISVLREEQQNTEEQRLAMEEQRKNIEDRKFQMQAERKNLEEQRETLTALLEASREDLEEALTRIPQSDGKPAYAIALDNHPNARPQHGLSRASVVYEYEVEGRATRYLALFHELPSKVGPIRSARKHSTMLAWENNVNFITASASRDNLQTIRDWGVNYTNALSHGAFYRDNARRAPHNLYVNLSTLREGNPSPGSILRPAHISRQGTSANRFSIEYSPNYRVSYQYSEEQEAYQRLINGSPHRDATGTSIWARNVIVQYTNHPTDSWGRTTPEVLGEGAIDYYVSGQRFRGTWKKTGPNAKTRFYYEDGQEIERIYGSTWIQIARP